MMIASENTIMKVMKNYKLEEVTVQMINSIKIRFFQMIMGSGFYKIDFW